MKKNLFLAVLGGAIFSLTACTNESDEYVGDSQQAKEIAFSPVTQNATRAVVDGTTFPTTSDIYIAAYDATNSRQFFGNTTFGYKYAGGSYNASNEAYWGDKTSAKYWPFSACTINFLAYANFTSGTATWETNTEAHKVELAMADNHSTQNDLMYAAGQGAVTQSGNALTIPTKVDMDFKHAQSWISFYVKASVASAITITSITLNQAYYSGTCTVTNANYASTSAASLTASWESQSSQQDVSAFSGSQAVTTSYVVAGTSDSNNGLMVVPATTGFTTFTISYTMNGLSYTYTYTPVSTTLEAGKHYLYYIDFTLHEILVNATLTDWTDVPNYVDVPMKTFDASSATSGTYTLASATAGTYTVKITGLTSDNYTITEDSSDGVDNITSFTPTSATSATDITIAFTVSGTSGSDKLVIKDSSSNTDFTLTVTTP